MCNRFQRVYKGHVKFVSGVGWPITSGHFNHILYLKGNTAPISRENNFSCYLTSISLFPYICNKSYINYIVSIFLKCVLKCFTV